MIFYSIYRRPSGLSAPLVGLFRAGLLVLAAALAGCLGHTEGSLAPGTSLGSSAQAGSADNPVFPAYGNYFVERLPADGRGINRLIVDSLRERGLKATTGEPGAIPPGTDVVIRYQDRWMWDTTMYMTRLNMQLLSMDGKLLASGESYRTSMIRKPPTFMINEILNQFYAEIAPDLVVPLQEHEGKPTRRSRGGISNYSDSYRL